MAHQVSHPCYCLVPLLPLHPCNHLKSMLLCCSHTSISFPHYHVIPMLPCCLHATVMSPFYHLVHATIPSHAAIMSMLPSCSHAICFPMLLSHLHATVSIPCYHIISMLLYCLLINILFPWYHLITTLSSCPPQHLPRALYTATSNLNTATRYSHWLKNSAMQLLFCI